MSESERQNRARSKPLPPLLRRLSGRLWRYPPRAPDRYDALGCGLSDAAISHPETARDDLDQGCTTARSRGYDNIMPRLGRQADLDWSMSHWSRPCRAGRVKDPLSRRGSDLNHWDACYLMMRSGAAGSSMPYRTDPRPKASGMVRCFARHRRSLRLMAPRDHVRFDRCRTLPRTAGFNGLPARSAVTVR